MRWSLQHARRPRQRNSTSITPWRLPSSLNALKDFFPNPRQHRLRFAYVCAWKPSGLLRVTESFNAKLDARMRAVNTPRKLRRNLSYSCLSDLDKNGGASAPPQCSYSKSCAAKLAQQLEHALL